MILLTGATGYIGTHTWIELLGQNYDVLGLDNFSNSSPKVLTRLNQLSGKKINFLECDLRDSHELRRLFDKYSIQAVIHFAALKAVGESVKFPISYYQNNINGLLNLIEVMSDYSCHRLVYSSSATVYHPDNPIPYLETMSLGSSSPYGWSKLMGEQILRDWEKSNPDVSVACLRYFNPVGAHPSGLIGEDPKGVPNNLMPLLTQVAVGRREFLSIYGDDWPTPDGTGVRDYIHVMDLANGHLVALDHLLSNRGSLTVNLGSGRGHSVLELIKTFEDSTGVGIPYRRAQRRLGDIAAFYADASLAQEKLGWSTRYDLKRMCEDSWRWQNMNPNGYE